MLRERGYKRANSAVDEVNMWQHPDKQRPVPINPDWPPMYPDNPIFRAL